MTHQKRGAWTNIQTDRLPNALSPCNTAVNNGIHSLFKDTDYMTQKEAVLYTTYLYMITRPCMLLESSAKESSPTEPKKIFRYIFYSLTGSALSD